MTGLELLGLAEPLVSRLASHGLRSLTLRYRVTHRIRRSLGFDFPSRKFRRWLKELEPADLFAPIEQGGAALARTLDDRLAVDESWRNNPSHLSLSLRLVEATYLAILDLFGGPATESLRDIWATARHVELLQAMVAAHGWQLPLSPGDRAQLLRGESAARRSVRTEWTGLPPEKLAEAFRFLSAHVPSQDPGHVTILVGPLGSGKSELCEEWFLGAIDLYESGTTKPYPVWVDASELIANTLETHLSARITLQEAHLRGVALVVDGLDEVDAPVSARIVGQAKALTRTFDKSTALLASRPGVLRDVGAEVLWDGLEPEDALRLIESVAGLSHPVWGWSSALLDTIRRPFFAIAAGLVIAEGGNPGGQAELIDRLVKRALSRPSAASSSIDSADDFSLLVKLAVERTRSTDLGDGLTFRERLQVLRSTLTHEDADGGVRFSLPIFEQWFAANAVLESTGLVDEAFASPVNFGRWRWALAVAGIAASPNQLDDLLERSVRANPGAGAWLLQRIADGHESFRDDDAAIVDPVSAPSRLLRATRTWLDSIGELAPMFYPVEGSEAITLGVRVYGNRVDTGWRRGKFARDSVVTLPAEVHPLAPAKGDWWAERAGGIAEGHEWPWILSQHRIATGLLPMLNRAPFLGPVGGVWHQESRYRALRRLTGKNSLFFPPISRASGLATVGQLLDQLPDPIHTAVRLGRLDISGLQLLDLAYWLSSCDEENIERSVPIPDLDSATASGGYTWDVYSPRRLQEFYAAVLGRACTVYDELAGTVLSKFSWSLGSLAEGHFGVIADLSYAGGWGPTISSAKVPISLFREAERQFGGAGLIAPNRRALVSYSPTSSDSKSWIPQFLRDYVDSMVGARSLNPFSTLGSYTESVTDHTIKNRPASSFAAHWVSEDFQAFGLGRGAVPQLED